MTRSLLVRGTVLLAIAFGLAIWGLSQVTTAWSVFDVTHAERGDLRQTAGTWVGTDGWGPWRLDVVELPSGGSDVVVVHAVPRPGDTTTGRDTRTVLVSEPITSGAVARYPDAPPTPNAWIPFVALATVLLGGAGLALWRSLKPLSTAVFGQRDPAARPVGWVPGGGGHGGPGGQSPRTCRTTRTGTPARAGGGSGTISRGPRPPRAGAPDGPRRPAPRRPSARR